MAHEKLGNEHIEVQVDTESAAATVELRSAGIAWRFEPAPASLDPGRLFFSGPRKPLEFSDSGAFKRRGSGFGVR